MVECMSIKNVWNDSYLYNCFIIIQKILFNLIKASNKNPCSFITAGEKTIRVWRVDLKNRKLLPEECNLGSLKKSFKN